MRLRDICALALLWAAMAVTLHAAEPPVVRVIDPRGFGYFVGDLVTRTIDVEAAPGETFLPASLPRPGQLAYWLDLREVTPGETTRGGTRRLTLQLTYQMFYVPLDPRRLVIPASNIELAGAAGNRIASIPPFAFLASPIREIYPEKSGETTATFLKADADAERLPAGPTRTAALISGLATLLSLGLLAHHRAWWPFQTRPGRPFTEAARTVSDHRQSYGTALIALHRAFDQAHSERLLAGDVDDFFAHRPEQTGARGDVERFFSASRTFFFAGDAVAAEAVLPRSKLESLAGKLAANEKAS